MFEVVVEFDGFLEEEFVETTLFIKLLNPPPTFEVFLPPLFCTRGGEEGKSGSCMGGGKALIEPGGEF